MNLKEAYDKFNEKHSFAPGDIIEWKSGMKYKRSEGPFVVVEVLDKPVMDPTTEAGTCYFRDRLDIVAGHLDKDGDFICYHYDSRRFQPASE